MREELIKDLEKGLKIYTEEDFLKDINSKEWEWYYEGNSLNKLMELWNRRTKGHKYCFKVVDDEGFYSIPFLISELSKDI